MKTYLFNGALLLICSILFSFASCKKASSPSTTDPEINAAIEGMRTSYNDAKIYNDSLNYWYTLDSTRYIVMMNHCDDIYHSFNSIMMSNYDIMNSGGVMMSGKSNSNGMMDGCKSCGNMMNGKKPQINCTIKGTDCTTMINYLHQQHVHHPTH